MTNFDNNPTEMPVPYGPLGEVAYGYMRVPCRISDRKVKAMEARMRALADRHGWTLAQIFSEFNCGSHSAFDELLTALESAPSRTVVVPNLRHLAINPFLQDQMILQLEGWDSDQGLGVLDLEEYENVGCPATKLGDVEIPSARRGSRERRLASHSQSRVG
ncbi:Uncharacterised protein [Amycolatopsis camponoti]|uniref:Resolvase/invertase-type recombinase catalytic domain-containing protein n=1 Tax=Amycolatopsis camponoti TaxID=2606593 RepID=A0A6I8M3L1_9PSEU|nr:recombinase family protein [Amycolatopsis camponoti]VVJ22651.1 Uncharacterised protein [Amycolatopsis camponoti]